MWNSLYTQMYTYLVHDMRAVGMHHHAPPELILHGKYQLKWEPSNPQDLGNAIEITDAQGMRRAYLTRRDAHTISMLFYGNSVYGTITCIPSSVAYVVQQKLGPQHDCTLHFSIDDSEHDYVAFILRRDNCNFEYCKC